MDGAARVRTVVRRPFAAVGTLVGRSYGSLNSLRATAVAMATSLLTVVTAIVAIGVLGGSASAQTASARPADPCGPAWVTAWQTSPQPGVAGALLAGRTLRMIATPQVTGSEMRVRLSNRYGRSPLVVSAVSAAGVDSGAALAPGTSRPVYFGGSQGVTIPPGEDVASDPVPFVAEAGRPLAVSMFLPSAADRVATHPVAMRTSYVSEPGSGIGAVDATDGSAFTTSVASWFVLSGVDVLAPRAENAVVLVGDSITDGVGSDLDRDDRWPDALSERLVDAGGLRMSVINAGISANQLLGGTPSQVGDTPAARFDGDVLGAAGVRDVVLHIGTNDLAAGRSADEVITGLVDFGARARGAGLRVFLTTITPSTTSTHGTPQAVAAREAVNAWIRAQGPAHADGVFDFAAAVADPAHPARLRPAYDSGDGLHLSPAGYRAMAAAVRTEGLTGSPCLADTDPARITVSGGR